MATKEEIREGIRKFLVDWQAYIPNGCDCDDCKVDTELVLDEFTKMLHSQGVVIKVDRELPWWRRTQIYKTLKILGAILAKDDKAGYTKWSPLI